MNKTTDENIPEKIKKRLEIKNKLDEEGLEKELNNRSTEPEYMDCPNPTRLTRT